MKRSVTILTTLFLAVLASPASGAKSPGPISGDVPLRVNEVAKRFDVPARTVIVRPGIETFSVVVPKSAKGRHGIAINGGQYRNVKGVSVRPGRATSITAQFKPGKYTVYDPYSNNRAKGFYVKVIVTANKGGKISLGTECSESDFLFGTTTFAWIDGTSCETAKQLSDAFAEAEHDPNYKWLPLDVMGFSCTTDPFARTGLTTTCVNGTQRVVFRGLH